MPEEPEVKELINYTIILSNNCNASCSFCVQKHQDQDLSMQRFKDIINKIIQKGAPYTLDFFGGEPLMNPNWISFLVFLKDLPQEHQPTKIIIFTNGLLLTEELFKQSTKIYPNIIFSISYDPDPSQRKYNLLERNPKIKELFRNKNIILSFSVFANPRNILKDYLLCLELTGDSSRVDWYPNRNYWEWNQKKLQNFQIGLNEFMNYYQNNFIILPARLKTYINLILTSNIKYGCGGGESRFTFNVEEDFVSCGVLDLKPNSTKVPSTNQIKDYCRGCPIETSCPKTCPILLEQVPPRVNNLCKIHKIIVAACMVSIRASQIITSTLKENNE